MWLVLSVTVQAAGVLGGVLGEVPGDLAGGQWAGGVVGAGPGAHGAHVDLGPEREDAGRVVIVDRFGQNGHGRHDVADEAGEVVAGERGRGGGAGACGGGPIEPDEGVEVDQSAGLVLGDLGVLHGCVLAQAALGDVQVVGNAAA